MLGVVVELATGYGGQGRPSLCFINFNATESSVYLCNLTYSQSQFPCMICSGASTNEAGIYSHFKIA